MPFSRPLAAGLLSAAATLLLGAAEPPSAGVSRPPAEAPLSVSAPALEPPLDGPRDVPRGPFLTRALPPASEDDKGSVETIGGDPNAPRTLTDGQRAKLARARAAVEAARAEGTLAAFLAPEEEFGPPLSLEAIEAMKLERLARQAPEPYDPTCDTPSSAEVR
jgi:hypothetical protein